MAERQLRTPHSTRVLAVALGLVTAALLAATIFAGVQDPVNKLANAILQSITFVAGLFASFVFGRMSAVAAGRELVRPHARSAFRRTMNLYRALARQREAIRRQVVFLEGCATSESEQVGTYVGLRYVHGALMTLDAIVVEQLATADDSVEDWRDLVPDEVAIIEAKRRGEVTS